jgi:hypothetical protein
MRIDRRFALGALLFVALGLACGTGPNTRLVTVRAGTGSGDVEFEVANATDVPINSMYFAQTAKVSTELKFDSPQGSAAWGGDVLTHAIPVGTRVKVPVPEPGVWDVRAVDRDGRYQHITALKLQPGGRFILELHDGSWRVDQ